MAILSALGVPNRIIGYMFVGFTIMIYAVIGILSRTMQVGEYYVAGRRVPAIYNGMATGADWMSGASFVGMAGTLYLLGYDGLAFVLGWTGGYVLVAILVAPYLRKFGAYTVPDFLSARYGGNLARFIGVVVLFSCSFTYVVAQIYATGIISARFLGLDFNVAVYVGLAGILVCSMLGGMRAVTWTQVAQYIVLIIAYLIPAIWMSTVKTGIPIPQLMQGQALQGIAALEAAQGIAVGHATPFSHGGYNALNYFLLILCLMVGTASLPHVLMRYFTTPSVREARVSVAWSLLFIFILYFTAPAYAAFAKWTMLDLVASGLTPENIADKAGWMLRWAAADNSLVQICGKAAIDAAAVAAACAEAGRDQHRLRQHQPERRHDRACHAGNGGHALRHLRPRRGRRSCRGAVDGGRPAARHRQRAQPRHLLQDDRPERADGAPPGGVARAAGGGGDRGRLCGLDEAGRHPGHGVVGLLARGGGALPGARARRLVEARQLGRRHRRHDRRLRRLPLLPARHALRRDRLLRDVERPVDRDTGGDRQVRRAQGSVRSRGSRRAGRGLGGARQACPDDRQLVGGEEPLGGGVRSAGRLRRDVSSCRG